MSDASAPSEVDRRSRLSLASMTTNLNVGSNPHTPIFDRSDRREKILTPRGEGRGAEWGRVLSSMKIAGRSAFCFSITTAIKLQRRQVSGLGMVMPTAKALLLELTVPEADAKPFRRTLINDAMVRLAGL
jgi:hypothetical protein